MNIQALLGARPEAGTTRRPALHEKERGRARVQGADDDAPDVVELSVEGKRRAADDSQDDRS